MNHENALRGRNAHRARITESITAGQGPMKTSVSGIVDVLAAGPIRK